MRALAFGTPDGTLWGAALGAGDERPPSLVLGNAQSGTARGEGLSLTAEADGSWRLEGDGVALRVIADAVPTPAPTDEPDEVLAAPAAQFVSGEGPEAVRVVGTVALDGGPTREVDCAGSRLELGEPRSARHAPASTRLVAGWMADGAAFSCLALRPRSAGGDHEDDRAYATLLDPGRWIRVSDPRLSTTYDRHGTPTRTNLELWIGSEDHEYPRRVAGEVRGAGAAVPGPAGSDPALIVLPLRCHSRGEEGAGVYALATF